MKRIVQSLLRRLDLRIARASSVEQLLARAAASERRAAELENKLALLGSRDATPVAADGPEAIDHIVAKMQTDGTSMLPQALAAVCADYSALATVGARQRVSERLLTAMLAGDLSQSDILSEPSIKPLAAHELCRQIAATRSFAAGRLDESAAAWKQISVDVPSPFNLACYGRVLVAQDNRKDGFAVLADGVERYPRSVLMATELAMFFMRIGDIDAANVALGGVSHAFLDERSALTPQQAELDRAIDEGRSGVAAPLSSGRHQAGAQVEEFQNPLAAREAVRRRLTERIVGEAKGAITRTVEAGPATMTAEAAGAHVLLSQTADAGNCYPAMLTQFYRRCGELGIKHLLVGETIDFDRDSLRYHARGEFPRTSRLGGGGRFLHDYCKMLDDAGYALAESVNVPPTLAPNLAVPDPGYRLLHAVRRD
jgi:hypothetical protein